MDRLFQVTRYFYTCFPADLLQHAATFADNNALLAVAFDPDDRMNAYAPLLLLIPLDLHGQTVR